MATRKKSPEKRPKAKAPPKRSEPKTKAATKPDVKVERFRQNMRCELSEDEIVERSRRISRQLSEKALRVEAAKSATAHLKAEIKQIDAEVSRLAQEVNDGACYKEVECERRFIFRTGKVIEVRLDTDQQTFERAMTGSERQLPLGTDRGKPDTSQAKASLEKALGHPVVEEDGPGEEAPDVPGADDARPSEPEPEEDEDSPESGEQAAQHTGDVPAE